jgi:ubiquinone/menaquinone biosynthesis C-methylase UbiE
MVAFTKAKAEAEHLVNLVVRQCDFDESGTGLDDAIADYAMLFNILHTERPYVLLREARRVLNLGGTLAVMHWHYDSTTPRGPSMGIRLRPEQCMDLVRESGFTIEMNALAQFPPYHYGFVARRAD